MFKEFGELRHIVNFKRVIFPISIAFFIYTFGGGISARYLTINCFTKRARLQYKRRNRNISARNRTNRKGL